MRKLCRVRKTEFALSIACFLGVALLGVIEGIFIAVALALLNFIRRAWRPYDAVLGRVDGLKGYHDVYPPPRRPSGCPDWCSSDGTHPCSSPTPRSSAGPCRGGHGDVADAGTLGRRGRRTGDRRRHHRRRRAPGACDDDLAAEGVDLRFAEMKGPVEGQAAALRPLRAVRRRPLLPHGRGRGERLPRDDGGRVDRLGGSPGTHAPRTRVRSAQDHPLGGARRRGVRQAHHAERVEQPERGRRGSG